ncbi:flagellar motor protein MotP [Fervidicella metallireducens AeB]|uniref:Flagellar motor protein MotP n=1 Tax=Fervidicella metallireducens AeB TaxID=1403537 RepID=A0A017RVJ4_9CLOT|nr:motility protein A [Fervidicella metallireducens]EYE88803.1 flagellar motor protein MotP [Fervidicella metallireducens AeB]
MKKNDLSTGLGLILGVIAIILGMLNGGSPKMFWDLPSVFITLFGSLFAIIINYPLSTLKKLPKSLKNAFLDKQIQPDEIIVKFVEIAKKARREGLLSLEDDINSIDDEYLKNGMQMVVDGIEPETIREILELEINEMERRHQSSISVLKTWASFAPAFGMIGTLIGLIQMLAKLEDQSQLGKGMSVALITSFYGAVLANLIFTPLAGKLEIKSEEEANRREMMLEGILALQAGVNPRIMEDKLKTYLSPETRLKLKDVNGEARVVEQNE